jgi:hypothetical protein
MMDYNQIYQEYENYQEPRQQQFGGGGFQGGPGGGFPGGGFPGGPSGGFPGGGQQQINRLEREVNRLQREINRLENRVLRLERRLGFSQ